MKNYLQNIFVVSLIFIGACSNPPEGKKEDLTGLLPEQILGFVSADLQSKQARSFIGSPAYKSYMSNLKSSLDQNKQLAGDLAIYWSVLENLKLLPAEGEDSLPFGAILFYAVPSEQRPFDFAAYYNTTSSIDARQLIASAQAILNQAKVEVENLQHTDYNGIIVRPFSHGSVSPAIQEVYRDQLKLDTFYLAASQSRLVIASTKELLERGFNAAKQQSKALLDSAEYKRIISDASANQEVMSTGMIDAHRIFQRVTSREVEPEKFPLSMIGFAARLEQDLILLNAVGMVKSTDPEVQRLKGLLTAPVTGKIFDALPSSLAFGVSFDAALTGRALLEFAKETPPEVLELFKSLQTVGLGVQNSEMASIYPDIIIAAKSSDPKGVVDTIIRLSQQLLPAGMVWRDAAFGENEGKLLLTPLGIGVRLAHNSDTVVVSSGEQLVSDVLGKDNSKRLGGSRPIASVADANPAARAGLFIDYPKLTALLQSAMQSAAMFSNDAISKGVFSNETLELQRASLNQFKSLGKVVIALGYDQDILRLTYSQQLSPK